jgi:hypothetical protein
MKSSSPIQVAMDLPVGGGELDPTPGQTLSEALSSAFSLTSGGVRLTWNQLEYFLPYSMDLAEISSALVYVLHRLLTEGGGELDVALATSLFPHRWQVHWSVGKVQVAASAAFSARERNRLVGNELVSSTPLSFVQSWEPVLCLWSERLNALGYSADQVPELEKLQSVLRILSTGPVQRQR